MMISSGVEWTDMPQGIEACTRASVVLVAVACWSRHIPRTTYAIESAPSRVWDCTLQNAVRPIRRATLAV
jgi:hypothetical protein